MSGPGPGGAARSPQDIVGGIVLAAIAVLALYLVRDLPGSGRVGFASGTAPKLFAYVLLALGGIIAVMGWLKEGPGIDNFAVGMFVLTVASGILFAGTLLFDQFALPGSAVLVGGVVLLAGLLLALARIDGFPRTSRFGIRGMVAVLGSVLLFAVAIRTVGLALVGIPMILLATAAVPGYRWIEAILFALGMTIFCALLFPIALGQPIPLWPTF